MAPRLSETALGEAHSAVTLRTRLGVDSRPAPCLALSKVLTIKAGWHDAVRTVTGREPKPCQVKPWGWGGRKKPLASAAHGGRGGLSHHAEGTPHLKPPARTVHLCVYAQ